MQPAQTPAPALHDMCIIQTGMNQKTVFTALVCVVSVWIHSVIAATAIVIASCSGAPRQGRSAWPPVAAPLLWVRDASMILLIQ